jgi:hypothetical protein
MRSILFALLIFLANHSILLAETIFRAEKVLGVSNYSFNKPIELNGKPAVDIMVGKSEKYKLHITIVKDKIYQGYIKRIINQYSGEIQAGGAWGDTMLGFTGKRGYFKIIINRVDIGKEIVEMSIEGIFDGFVIDERLKSIPLGRQYRLPNTKIKITGSDFKNLYIGSQSNVASGEITILSQKASEIKLGMSRKVVINLLGHPTWAVIPSDKGELALPDTRIKLELYWKNTPCSPVIVQFNSTYEVTGLDEGIGFCGNQVHLFEPSDEYSCRKSDRAKFCNSH